MRFARLGWLWIWILDLGEGEESLHYFKKAYETLRQRVVQLGFAEKFG
jgi:hypothetical protein